MDQPDLVSGMQGPGDVVNDAHCAGGFQRPVGQHGVQIAARDQPHAHEQSTVDLPVVIDRNHMWGVQPCRRMRFPTEPLLKVLILRQGRRQNLDGDDAVGDGVVGAPHLTHAAAAEQVHQAVTPERHALHSSPLHRKPPQAASTITLPLMIPADDRPLGPGARRCIGMGERRDSPQFDVVNLLAFADSWSTAERGGEPMPAGNVMGPALMLATIVVIVLSTGLWVYSDAKLQAKQRSPVLFSTGSFELTTPARWFIACLLVWELFFPLYLDSRSPTG